MTNNNFEEFPQDRDTTAGDLKKFLKDIPDECTVYLDTRPSSYEERKPDQKSMGHSLESHHRNYPYSSKGTTRDAFKAARERST